eukprot:10474647-Alexandrium_andersonii.AAC.1
MSCEIRPSDKNPAVGGFRQSVQRARNSFTGLNSEGIGIPENHRDCRWRRSDSGGCSGPRPRPEF